MADLLIGGGTVLTMDPERRVIRDGAVAVERDRIVAVGKTEEVRAAHPASRSLDAAGKLVMPGIVNAHLHFWHQLDKGLMPDNVNTWQFRRLAFPLAAAMTAEEEGWAARATLLETLKSGSTCFAEAGALHPLETNERAAAVGLRGWVGRWTFDQMGSADPRPDPDPEACLRETEALLKRFAGGRADGRIRPWVTLVGMGSASDRLLRRAKDLADDYRTRLCMHLSSTIGEVELTQDLTGLRPISHLRRLGVLGPNVVLVHMVVINKEEVKILRDHEVKVVHCPSTALKLGKGLAAAAKFPEMLDAGIPVGLGTDAADCSNTHDMLRMMYLAALLFKDIRYDLNLMGAETAIEMATLHGARVLGMEGEIGSLEPGKKADVTIFDMNRPEWVPLHNPVQSLVYSAGGESADTVLVDGQVVMEGRKVRTVDEGEILERTQAMASAVARRAGIQPQTRWRWV